MSRDEILEKVFKILSKTFARRGKEINFSESTTLAELDVNSTQMIDIVLDLEDEFGVNISDSDMPKLETVGEIVTAIATLLEASRNTGG